MSIQFASDTDHAATVKAALHSQQQAPFPLTISQLFLRNNPEQRAEYAQSITGQREPGHAYRPGRQHRQLQRRRHASAHHA
jgi:hypothetical protein